MAQETSLNDVILCLYDAATDFDMWPVFLDRLQETFGGRGAHIFHVDPENEQLTFSVIHGMDDFISECYQIEENITFDMAMEAYTRHFTALVPIDPRIAAVQNFPSKAMTTSDAVSDDEWHACQMYKEINYPGDAEYSMIVGIPEDNGYLTGLGVHRRRESSDFTPAEVSSFGLLIPHLKKAISLQRKFAHLDFDRRVTLEALDHFPLGMILMNQDGKIINANRGASEILEQADGLTEIDNKLVVANEAEHNELMRAVSTAIHSARQGNIQPGHAQMISRASDAEPYPAVVRTLWGNHLRFGLGMINEPVAVLFITIPGLPQESPTELLRRLFGLTPQEARLTECLVNGQSLRKSGDALGISNETARVHLRNIFSKTDTNRQGELIAKVLATPVWMDLSEQQVQWMRGQTES